VAGVAGVSDARKRATRDNLPSRLAAAGRWAGERDRGRGWEDMLAEFLAAIFTWAGIGWLVDRWLDTDPWFMIAGAVLGNSLGIYLLWLRSDPDRGKTSSGPDTTGGDSP
jgi:F0F1-type ATP synthase assembly protein I